MVILIILVVMLLIFAVGFSKEYKSFGYFCLFLFAFFILFLGILLLRSKSDNNENIKPTIATQDDLITNPKEVYKKVFGSYPKNKVTVINGQYWESMHWSTEYKAFLEFKCDEKAWEGLIYNNKLEIFSGKDNIMINNKPKWFNPTDKFITYKPTSNRNQNTRFYRDTITQICFIYKIEL